LTREEEDARGGERPAKGDKRRKTKIGPKMRIGLRQGKSKGRVNAKKRRKEGKRRWRTVSRRVGLANG